MSTDLNTPILDEGLERVPFFNGRVLTAEDLQTEQNANAAERRRLGRALGSGVLEGLFVRKSTDETVTVEPGLGLAPSGRMVHLPREVEVSVVSNIERDQTAGTGGDFEDCLTLEATVTSGTGAYVLFAEPASGTEGRTPRTTIGGDGAAGECGAERRVEGASLRLACLNPDLFPDSIRGAIRKERDEYDQAVDNPNGDPTPHASKLRNLLAHACLRTPSALTDTASLYDTLRAQSRGNAEPAEGPLDVLRKQARDRNRVDGLNDAVPLGLLYWAGDGILFVDAWSVRRRVHRPDPQRPVPATAHRRAETEAAIYQFQAQVADLVERLSFRERVRVRVEKYVQFLPPFGAIPSENELQDGFDRHVFFENLATRPSLFVEGDMLGHLMSQAKRFNSFRVSTEQLVWRYEVRQDVQSGGRDDQPSFVAFTSGFLPHAAEPQYNRSRWGYANYGPGVAVH